MRRAWAWLLALTLLSTAALAEPGWVRLGDYGAPGSCEMLIETETGVPITPEGVYAEIGQIYNSPEEAPMFSAASFEGLSRYDNEEFYMSPRGLMDAQGNLLTECEYAYFQYFPEADVLVATRPDETVCGLSARGEVLLDGDYRWLVPNGEGGWLAMETDSNVDGKGELLYVDAQGRGFSTGIWAESWRCGTFSSGLCRINLGDDAVFLNPEGAEALRIPEADAWDFYLDTVVVCHRNDVYGVFDKQGNPVIAGDYVSISRETGYGGEVILLALRSDGVLEIYDASARELRTTCAFDAPITSAWQESGHTISAWLDDERWVLTTDGEVLARMDSATDEYIDTYYYKTEPGEMPQRYVISRGSWATGTSQLMDLQGNPVGGEYQTMAAMSWKDGEGRYLVSRFELHEVDYGNGPFMDMDRSSQRYGICDENGELVIAMNFDSISLLDFDRYWVSLGEEYYMLDGEGNVLTAFSMYNQLMD